MKILVLNAGSSTLKFSLFDVAAGDETERADGMLDWSDGSRPAQARLTARHVAGDEHLTWEVPADCRTEGVAEVLAALARPDPPLIAAPAEIAAVGHRVVHGGVTYQQSVRITPAVQAEIARLAALAPLHNPPALAGHRGGGARPARRAPGGRVRHRLPRHPAARRLSSTRCPTPGPPTGASAASASTASAMPIAPGAPPNCWVAPWPSCAWSPATWATAARWPPSPGAARWIRRWASPRSKG